jgi:hypothetical protein
MATNPVTEPVSGLALESRRPAHSDELWGLSIATALLKWRRTIVVLGLIGGIMGGTIGLLSKRQYLSRAVLLPQASSEVSASGLEAAAAQFGFRLPTSNTVWSPAIYVEVLRSTGLLQPIALDTVTVVEDGGRTARVIDLLEIDEPSAPRRIELAVRRLRTMVSGRELKPLNSVELRVVTKWPSVSLAITQRLVAAVDRFNVQTRRSQAASERQFADEQASAAERELRITEDRLQVFLQSNRGWDQSPALSFQHDRLEREVTFRQTLYTALARSREEARAREVRDTPVLTVLEAPRLPAIPESRRVVLKAALGGMMGGAIALFLAIGAQVLSGAKQRPDERSQEFYRLVREATPRLLRRGKR